MTMQKIIIEIIKHNQFPKKYESLMNKWRKKEFGPSEVKNFKKDYLPGAIFFFVKDNKRIVAFGGLRKITIEYLGKKYNILGICNIVSIEKGKGYGQLLISAMIAYLKKTGKTGVGFCNKDVSKFYEKAGLKVVKNLTQRFVLKNPKTGEIKIDEEGGDGIYIEGKDKFIQKLLSTKGTAYYYLPDIKKPHW